MAYERLLWEAMGPEFLQDSVVSPDELVETLRTWLCAAVVRYPCG